MSYYPAFIDVRERPCVVLGGGEVAWRKVVDLLRAGATVTVVAPRLCLELQRLAHHNRVRAVRRAYQCGDLAEAFLAVDASGNAAVNRAAFAEAQSNRVLINVVDRPRRCSFIAPAVVHRDPLMIAISTSGATPYVCSELRMQLERLVGPEWGPFVDLVGRIRRALRANRTPSKVQALIYRELIDSRILELLRLGCNHEAQSLAALIASTPQEQVPRPDLGCADRYEGRETGVTALGKDHRQGRGHG